MKLRRISIFVACMMIMLSVAVAGNASAEATTLVKGQTYDFYTADGGADSGTGLFTTGSHSEAGRKAGAMSQTIGAGYGASGWGEVWKAVNSGSSTYYSTVVEGHWWCVISAAGGAYAEVWFNVRVKNLDTGSLVFDYIITHYQTAILWAHNAQADFSVPFTWSGASGVHYGIEVFALASTGGIIGTAIADAIGDQGIWFNHIRVSSSSGGGGCVLAGTEITMSDGSTKLVEKVRKGDIVLAYDTASGSMTSATVLSNKKKNVDMVEVINNGSLVVTPLNQPIYARNGSFEGWVANPADLKVGWQLFCPLLDDPWMNITDIHFELGNFGVYDIDATSPNNYIANGVLLDKKVM